jgi:hypothetical protein
VLQTRMQPIGIACKKLPRLVRDLATELRKPVELEMHGAETELDRQVLELIKDPLTHMVRNAADHGVEAPPSALQVESPNAAPSGCPPASGAGTSSSMCPTTDAVSTWIASPAEHCTLALRRRRTWRE